MSVSPEGMDAAARCADVVRSHDFVRYASTLFAPAAHRRALLALYAFNVEIGRVPTQVSQPLPGEVRLQWWSDMLEGRGHGGIEGNPVAAELLLAIETFGLPVERLLRLIEAHQFDLYNDPMPTMAALESYLDGTSSALFAMAALVSGSTPGEVEHLAHHVGLAQGIAQVISSLPLDAARGRLFIPMQILATHGGGAEEVFAGKDTPDLRAALNEILAQARTHLSTALSLLATVPPEARTVFLPLACVRQELKRLSRADHDPFEPRSPSRLKILWALWMASHSRAFTRQRPAASVR